MKYRLKVRINGTNENPFHCMGLSCNPFPQLGIQEYAVMERRIAELGGDPIKDVDELKKRLKGASQEFIDLCVKMYKPGEMVEFDITFEG